MDQETRSLAEILDLHPLLSAAWHAGSAAGRFLRDERPQVLTVDTKSTPTDSVTVMDRTAEAMISAALLGSRPDDGLLGEEGGERLGTSGVRWIVDPLDGTVNYLFRLPMWGVSIAAEENGVVTVGVIITPEFDEGFIGVLGHGAWRIDGATATRLRSSQCSRLDDALLTTGFGYAPEVRRAQSDVVTGLIAQVRDVRRIGSAVIDFTWLAMGRLDAYYERGLNAWDYAAGALIAREAGAFVSGLRDDDLSPFVFAAAPAIAGELRALLVDLNADLS